MRRVVINLSTDSLRRREREQRAVARLPSPMPASPPDPSDEVFWRAVRALPDRQRAIVALFYLEDLPVQEIADVLQIRTGTVKATLFNARRSLARTLGAEEVTA